jgi:hypothetical protein
MEGISYQPVRPLYRFAIAHPRWTLALAAVALLLLAPGLARLRLRTDGRALVPGDAAEIAVDREVRALFGIADAIAVVVAAPAGGDVFDAPTLALVAELTRELQELPELEPGDVQSLATEPGLTVAPGTLDFRPWLDPLPASAEELARLRADVLDLGIYAGTLLSFEPGRATAILVRVRDGPGEIDRRELHRSLTAAVARHAGGAPTIHVVGAPIAESLLWDHVRADLVRLVPLCALLLALVFYLGFRSGWAVLLPLVEVAAALLATFALMGWSGVPVYLTIAVLPVILVAIGASDEVHLFHAYLRRLERDEAPAAGGAATDSLGVALDRTLEEMWPALAQTSLTTALGFLSFALAPIPPVRAFGVFMAVGIAVCFLWTLTVIPACLRLIGPTRLLSPRARTGAGAAARVGERLGSLCAGIGTAVLARPALVLAVAGATLVCAPFAAARVRVEDRWIDGFSPRSALRRSTEFVDRAFGGTHLLRVHVDGRVERRSGALALADCTATGALLRGVPAEAAGGLLFARCVLRVDQGPDAAPLELALRVAGVEPRAEGVFVELRHRLGPVGRVLPTAARSLAFSLDSAGRLLEPPLLARVAELERFLEARSDDGVGRVLGPCAYLETTNYIRGSRAPGTRALPDSAEGLNALVERFAAARGADARRELFTPDLDGTLITAFLAHASFASTARLVDGLRAYEREHLAPHGLRLRFAGDTVESRVLIASIVTTQRRSLLLSLAAIFGASALLFRSATLGVLCVLPAGAAVLIVFAGMGIAGAPLGVATSMFAAMTIGLGVDQAIHLVARWRRCVRGGARGDEAVVLALRQAGPPVLIDAAAVALGFGLLAFSGVPINARLGAMALASVAACLATTLGVIPVLLTALRRGGSDTLDRRSPQP